MDGKALKEFRRKHGVSQTELYAEFNLTDLGVACSIENNRIPYYMEEQYDLLAERVLEIAKAKLKEAESEN